MTRKKTYRIGVAQLRVAPDDMELNTCGILDAVEEIGRTRPILFPAHPRTRTALAECGFDGRVRAMEGPSHRSAGERNGMDR